MKMEHALAAGRAIGALQQNGAFKHPLAKMAMRYWWLSVPAGIALYGRIQERREKGETRVHHYFATAAEVLGPIMTVVTMAELAFKLDREGRLDDRIDARIAAVKQQQAAPAGTQGLSRLHGDIIHPPQYSDNPPPPHLQRG